VGEVNCTAWPMLFPNVEASGFRATSHEAGVECAPGYTQTSAHLAAAPHSSAIRVERRYDGFSGGRSAATTERLRQPTIVEH